MRENFGEESERYLTALDGYLGPTFPYAVQYLKDWFEELFGTSGEGMNGYAALTPTAIQSWAAVCGIEVLPHEMRALRWFDRIRRSPPKEDEEL